jgi:hypothetical protein
MSSSIDRAPERRRPSWPLVAMITAIANRIITALKIKNLAVFDAGTTS